MSMAIVKEWNNEEVQPEIRDIGDVSMDKLVDEYEYAYWLGYIYRCECLLHDESSRMVYGVFDETRMREFYSRLAFDEDALLVECAPEICRRLDAMLVGNLWKKEEGEEHNG